MNKTKIIITGFAMFSMFFGAGNIVFPLALGQIAQDKNFFAICGMLITAVGVPFLGLIAMTLFNGDYKRFFGRIGKTPGFLVTVIILGLIGPFGAIPRCIALSYSTIKILMPNLSLVIFSAFSCTVICLFTFKKNTIIDTLGLILTPVLLASLCLIIIQGFITLSPPSFTTHESFVLFLKGLKDGYQTMDLLGAFFFSSVIIFGLKSGTSEMSQKNLILITIQSMIVGASLLAFTYIGFSYVAAFHSGALEQISSDELISRVAIHLLGHHAAAVACIAVALACLTTAIALAVVFAEFIHLDIAKDRVSYGFSLLITLVITFFISILNFNGIAAFLVPILQVCYPALIMMTCLNILYKLYGFKPIKVPVLIVFLISLTVHFLEGV